MFQMAGVLVVCSLGLLPLALLGFSSGGLTLIRNLNQRAVLTNASIRVTAAFSNAGTNTLDGFFFCDEAPTAMTVTPLGVTLNGRTLTNFTFEAGQDGDVLAGYTPWRWVLETPTNFAQANPAPPQAAIQVTYLLSCTSTGTFILPQFSWAACALGTTNAFFGCSGSSDAQTVKFLDRPDNPLTSGQLAAGGFALWVDGVPGSIYEIAASTNLADWVPIATSLSPFAFVDTNSAAFAWRFYRAVPYTYPWAPLTLPSLPSGPFSFSVSGVQACNYVVEASTNLFDWSPLVTNVCPFDYFETNQQVFPMRFYRARLLAPP